MENRDLLFPYEKCLCVPTTNLPFGTCHYLAGEGGGGGGPLFGGEGHNFFPSCLGEGHNFF